MGGALHPPKFHAFGICPERDASRGGLRGQILELFS